MELYKKIYQIENLNKIISHVLVFLLNAYFIYIEMTSASSKFEMFVFKTILLSNYIN